MKKQLSILLCCVSLCPFSFGQIYKWVDEDGNVHFGDEPRDEVNAEQVEISQDYQPSVTTEQGREAIRQSLERSRRIAEQRRAEEDQLREQANSREEKRKKEQNKVCDDLNEKIAALSGISIENGRRVRYYLEDENGKSVTVAEQKQEIEALKTRAQQLGCQ